MRYGELIRKLRGLGIEFYRPSKGSHEVWWRPADGRRTIIRNHPNREIPKGTLNKILRAFDVSEEDLAGL